MLLCTSLVSYGSNEAHTTKTDVTFDITTVDMGSTVFAITPTFSYEVTTISSDLPNSKYVFTGDILLSKELNAPTPYTSERKDYFNYELGHYTYALATDPIPSQRADFGTHVGKFIENLVISKIIFLKNHASSLHYDFDCLDTKSISLLS